ncbi:hypothetical protein [Fundidesulfovibrio agrisoli]|uniref:hypothetical protein n=1 Tax=Fundidesulfovibrio agrisoli TaxID=2922717 RepID=UPI001FAC724B|nr:hypothetical protein [Fundidesulfovibrio agrisoli]
MTADWVDGLGRYVEKKPLTILGFTQGEWLALTSSRRGRSEFTFAREHVEFELLKPQSLCLLMGASEDGESRLYIGQVHSKKAITTIQTRIKITNHARLWPNSLREIEGLLTKTIHIAKFKGIIADLGAGCRTLTPKLGRHIIEVLANIDRNASPLNGAYLSIAPPDNRPPNYGFQKNAISTALKIFGLPANSEAYKLDIANQSESALSRVSILEDAVIEHEARFVDGYDLIGSDVTGRAVFLGNDGKLEVYTANRRELEHCLGVDLIYLNITKKNIVMLQYKMLEYSGKDDDDWIYRPDAQLDKEIRRMKVFSQTNTPLPQEYRINPAVFFLKFVKRDAYSQGGSMITPLDHYEQIVQSPECKGPRGGIRISYKSLSGRYLRPGAFMDLVGSGYIGAYAETTAGFKALIDAVLVDNQAVVAAIQHPVEDR